MASMDAQHSLNRIRQFHLEAGGNTEAYEKKMLLRAQRSSPEKNEVTASLLDQLGEVDLARRIRMSQVLKDVQL